MSLRRALCLTTLALLAACDDDLSEPALQDAAAQDASAALDATLDAYAEAPALLDASAPLDATMHDAVQADVDLPDAASALDCSTLDLSYENYGAEFLYVWCLSCHGKMEPLFTTPELVRLWAPAIRSETVDSKRMPAGGGLLYLRDPQRAELGRWLDCGAP
jgi:hypothetical protein